MRKPEDRNGDAADMTLEDLGNIGDFVGSIGVIASLIYLAIQIRRDTAQTALQTKATHATAFQNLIDHHSTLQMQMITNPELNEALRIAVDDPGSLSPAQTRLTYMFRTQQMRSFYNAYQLFENGLIDAKALRTFESNIKRVTKTHHFGEWWNRARQDYPTSFISHIEDLVNEQG